MSPRTSSVQPSRDGDASTALGSLFDAGQLFGEEIPSNFQPQPPPEAVSSHTYPGASPTKQVNLCPSVRQSEEDEKLKKRKERFGIVTSSAGAAAAEDAEVRALWGRWGWSWWGRHVAPHGLNVSASPTMASMLLRPRGCDPSSVNPRRLSHITRIEALTPFSSVLCSRLCSVLSGSGPSFKFVNSSGQVLCCFLDFLHFFPASNCSKFPSQ